MTRLTKTQISIMQTQQYQTEGFFILENALAPELLALARDCCDAALRAAELKRAQMPSPDNTNQKTLKSRRPDFLKLPHQSHPELDRLIFSPIMAEICRATIGEEAYLYYDQFVVKSPRTGTTITRHQDSYYVGGPHRPYINCWCVLDDVNEANGTVRLLSYERAGTRELLPALWTEQGKSAYRHEDPGIPVIVPAGSIAVFSSLVIHASGANLTDQPRRVYVIQFSPEPVLDPDTQQVQWLARPFLKSGLSVFD